MSERVFMMDSGDGVRRADNGSAGKGPKAKTASYTVSKHETGTIFTNAGASAQVTFSLPAAIKGLWFRFVKAVAAQTVSIKATGGAKINGGTANKVYEDTTSETGVCEVFSDGTDWFINAEKGTWGNNNA